MGIEGLQSMVLWSMENANLYNNSNAKNPKVNNSITNNKNLYDNSTIKNPKVNNFITNNINLYDNSNAKNQDKKEPTEYYIDGNGLLSNVGEYLTFKYKCESGNKNKYETIDLNDIAKGNIKKSINNKNLIIKEQGDDQFKKNIINEFINASCKYIKSMIDNLRNKNDQNIIKVYFDYCFRTKLSKSLPIKYLTQIYNKMSDKDKFLSTPLMYENNDKIEYMSLYNINEDENISEYKNMYLKKQQNNKAISEMLTSYIIKVYLKSEEKKQRQESREKGGSDTNFKYNVFIPSLINILIPHIACELKNEYKNEPVYFYGCAIESDFTIAKAIHSSESDYDKIIITNDSDFLLLALSPNNQHSEKIQILFKKNKIDDGNNSITIYEKSKEILESIQLNEDSIYSDIESTKIDKYVKPIDIWKMIMNSENIIYNDIILYSCLKGNDYTKHLFKIKAKDNQENISIEFLSEEFKKDFNISDENNKKWVSLNNLLKIGYINGNIRDKKYINMHDIKFFIKNYINNVLPKEARININVAIWLYRNYQELEPEENKFDLINLCNEYQDIKNVDYDYLIKRYYSY